MKVKFIAIILLVAVSCTKEKFSGDQAKSETESLDAKAAKQLSSDENFRKLYEISLPIFNTLRLHSSDLKELYNDNLITYNECKTLAPKLGFADSAALVAYFKEVYKLAPKIIKAHPGITTVQCQLAIEGPMLNNMAPEDPCTDAVVGAFITNVSQCAALGLIPVIGEALAGTCMVGALITYNSGLEACAEKTPQ